MQITDAPTKSPARPLTREDRLFAELDGHNVHSRTSHWLARVLGIHTDRDQTWIQLSLVGPIPCNVVLHLLPGSTARQAIEALSRWLNSAPTDRARIVEV